MPRQHTRGRHGPVRQVMRRPKNPMSRTPHRSNPATYGVWGQNPRCSPGAKLWVRGLVPDGSLVQHRGKPLPENNAGDGTLKIAVNFLPDVYVDCECHGQRYAGNREDSRSDLATAKSEPPAMLNRAHRGPHGSQRRRHAVRIALPGHPCGCRSVSYIRLDPGRRRRCRQANRSA